jgi:spore coat protein U-like protein
MLTRLTQLLILLLSSYVSIAMATCVGVGCSCTVAAPTLSFGVYDPKSNTDKTMDGTVNVTCNALLGVYTVSYVIALSTGTGTYTTRILTHSGHTINYNLYTTNTYTIVWGNGIAGTGTISDSYTSVLASEMRPYTVFGMIPKLQNAFVGTPYTDSIEVTVTY